MNSKDFFTTEYLFKVATPSGNSNLYILGGVFVLLILIAVGIYFSKKLHKGLKSRMFNFALTFGIVGLILLLFQWQAISYVGMRIVIIIFLLVMVAWYFWIVGYILITMPKEVRLIKNQERYAKYLPKKKGNKK